MCFIKAFNFSQPELLLILHENLPLEELEWENGRRGDVEFVSDEMKI
jgi:hypothetical protein